MVFKFLKKAESAQVNPPTKHSLPPGVRAYAIGDIHGRADLLSQVLDKIEADIAANPVFEHGYLIYIGDYIDRGLENPKVIELALNRQIHGLEAIYLAGNHEEALLDFIANPSQGAGWLGWGGIATVQSYGVTLHPDPAVMATALKEKIPEHHHRFYTQLQTHFQLGDYYFCHAGINPDLALDLQTRAELLWIREPFLSSDKVLGVCVVHGHTITEQPVFKHNRIGIDTGAYATGRLTVLKLEGSKRSVL